MGLERWLMFCWIPPLRRYIHHRLAQCPEQARLEARAQQLASSAGHSWPIVGPLEVHFDFIAAHSSVSWYLDTQSGPV